MQNETYNEQYICGNYYLDLVIKADPGVLSQLVKVFVTIVIDFNSCHINSIFNMTRFLDLFDFDLLPWVKSLGLTRSLSVLCLSGLL